MGEYRILREIGRGGMGVVYEAEQASLGRRVALKVLPFHSLLDSKRLERFLEEARAAARLSHPNIVPVYGVGEHLGMHYYVMQYIPGQGLNRVIEEVRRLRQAGGLAPGAADAASSSGLAAGLESGGVRGGRDRYFFNVARLVRDAALALDYAHGEGILHRDVKPSNLLLDPGGRIWLTDFGLAKVEGGDDLTKSGDFVGTILYMAPERFKGWSDPRSDVYSLGITLHELLTLRPAFVESDRAQLLRKVSSEEPPAPRRLDRAIPRDLETVVLKSIAKEPAQRYGSARAMAEDLDRFLDGLPVEARRSPAVARLGRWCMRHPLPAGLAAAVLVLLVVVAVVSSTAAVRLTGEQAAGQEKLRAAYLAEASALRASARPGRRFEAIEALRKAAAIRPGADLVDEAIACFAQVDLRLLRTWSKEKSDVFTLSPDGSVAALALPGGEISICAPEDGRERFRLPGPGFRTAHSWTAFSRDGKHLAARHELGQRVEWQVWDLDRRRICASAGDAVNDNCADFSPDGRWVILGTRERALRLLDLSSGDVLGEVGRGWQVERVAVHPGARLIAFSSRRTLKVHVYDLEGGRVVRSLAGGGDQRFIQVAWHPDGRTVAAANMDHFVYLWNGETGEITRSLEGHWAEVTGVYFNPQGSLLASGGWEPALRFWEPGSGRALFSLHGREGYFNFSGDRQCWSPAGSQVEFWELATALPAFTLFGHNRVTTDGQVAKHPRSISLASGGRLAATAGNDGVRLWDLASRKELAHLGESSVHGVVFDSAGTALYTSGERGLYRWPVQPSGGASTRITIGPVQRLTSLERLERVALAGDGSRIAAIHLKHHAHVLDPNHPEREVQLSGLPAPDWSIALSPDGAWAAAGTWGRQHADEVWLWDLCSGVAEGPAKPNQTLAPVRKLPAPRAEVRFHPGGMHLATGTPQDLTLWRIDDGEPVWRIEREPGLRYPGLIAFDRGGKTAAITYSHSRLWLIEALSARKLAELEAAEPIQVSALALEGGTLAATTPGRRIHVWDLDGLAREIAGLGLSWDVPAAGKAPEDAAPLRVVVVEESIDLLLDESPDLGERQLFRTQGSVAFLTELASCAEIDRALAAPSFLIPEGEQWKFFRGRAEPSPGMEWTSVDHDDGRWESGTSPLSGWKPAASAEATFLADQLGSYTTLYLRRAFEVADPRAILRLILAAEIEDGFVAYLNGEEAGRLRAGEPEERLSFEALAKRKDRARVTEVLELSPSLLRPGRNVLAIQLLSYGLDSRLHILPVLAAVLAPEAERDRRRTQNLLIGRDGAPDAFLLAYREGRVLQRAGQTSEALAQFERASELDRGAAEPLLRRQACHRALGEPARAEAVAREAIEAGEVIEDVRLWRAWHHSALVDLRLSPQEAIASLPRDPRAASTNAAGDHRWLLEELSAHGAIRIDCGGGGFEAPDGKRWERDRFFLGGSADKAAEAEGGEKPTGSEDTVPQAADPDHTERWFAGRGPYRRGYSVPLPPGRYRVALRFVERTHHRPGGRVFDILLEGKPMLEGCDPWMASFGLPYVRSFEVAVSDGALDLDFIAHRDNPRIAGIEVEALQ
jgi:WD40 repeat protein/tetratricopeptide (TPR) repeat protein